MELFQMLLLVPSVGFFLHVVLTACARVESSDRVTAILHKHKIALAYVAFAVCAVPLVSGLNFNLGPSEVWSTPERALFLAGAVALELMSPSAYFLVSLCLPIFCFSQCMIFGYFPTALQILLLVPRIVFFIGIFMSVCLHRYFSHRAFDTSRPVRLLIGLASCLAYQGGPLWWAAKHVRHHKHCDLKDDPHSVKQSGFLYAFLGWGLNPDSYSTSDYKYLDPSFLAPELKLVQLLNNVPSIIVCLWLTHLYGYPAMVFSWLTPSFFCRFITFLFNVEFHPANIETPTECKGQDRDRLLAVMVGESLHGDHHVHPRRAKRLDLDLPWWITIGPMQKLGLVWNCR